MLDKKLLFKIIFVFFVGLQVTASYMKAEINNILIAKLTLFEIAFAISYFFILFGLYKFIRDNKKDPNEKVIVLIFIYVLYQVIVLAPLLFFELNATKKEIIYFVLHRSIFLVIPFFYWYALPSFKKLGNSFRWIEFSALITLGLTILEYVSGDVGRTSTGELRVGYGVTAILFAFILITNLSILSGKKNNLILIFIAFIGLVLTNHRSAYLGLGIIILVSLLNSNRLKNKSKLLVQLALVALIVIIPLSQIDLIKDNFVGRVQTTLDYDDPNAKDRFFFYELSWEYFLQNPINGSIDDSHFYIDRSYEKISPPHNFIFQILSTQGIIGLILILSIIISLLQIAYKNKSDNISFQMFLAIIFYIIFSLLNFTFFNEANILMFFFPSAVILYRNIQLKDLKNFYNFAIVNSLSIAGVKSTDDRHPILSNQ